LASKNGGKISHRFPAKSDFCCDCSLLILFQKQHSSSQVHILYMNSANQKSKAFADSSPWSDKSPGRRGTPGKPPRSPASPYIYHEGTVSSPAFDSLGARTNRKRSARTNKQSKSPESPKLLKPESESPKQSSSSSLENGSPPTTPPKAKVASKQRVDQKQKQGDSTPSSTLDTPTPSVKSQDSAGDMASTLSASSQAFVPSESTLANLSASKSTKASTNRRVKTPSPQNSKSARQKQQVRARLLHGPDLKKMVAVLLKIVDKPAKAGDKAPSKKKIVALYPYLPDAAIISSSRRARKGRGTRDSPMRATNRARRRGSVHRQTRSA